MFSLLHLKTKDILEKTGDHKQATSTNSKRHEIANYLKVKDNVTLKGEKVLLVDDVYTTGSTMSACLALVKSLHPKKIKILVMSKTPNVKDR